MKDGVNKAILVGRIGKEPQRKDFGDHTILKFSLATSSSYKSKKTGEWEQQTEWHNITIWGTRAVGLSKFLKKGDPLYVEGKITTRSWDDDNGSKRYMTEIVANDIKLLRNKSSSNQEDQHGPPDDFSDSDIPF